MRYFSCHANALAQRRMRGDSLADIHPMCTYFNGQCNFANHVACVGADPYDFRVRVGDAWHDLGIERCASQPFVTLQFTCNRFSSHMRLMQSLVQLPGAMEHFWQTDESQLAHA